MTDDGIDRRQRLAPLIVVGVLAVVAVTVLVIGVVALFRGGGPRGVSDDDARAAAIHVAARLVHAGGLREVTGEFSFQPCENTVAPGHPERTDQPMPAKRPDGPPYTGRVDLTFAIPAGKDPQTYLKEVSVQLSIDGWQQPTGPAISDQWFTVIDGFGVILEPAPDQPARGRALVVGDCNNWTDHRGYDTTVDISSQLW